MRHEDSTFLSELHNCPINPFPTFSECSLFTTKLSTIFASTSKCQQMFTGDKTDICILYRDKGVSSKMTQA